MSDLHAALDECSPKPVPPPLFPGDPVPWFRANSDVNANFKFASLGGRIIVLSFLPSFSRDDGAALHDAFLAGADRFQSPSTALLLVTGDRGDGGKRLPSSMVGVRYFFDDERGIAALFGVTPDRPVSFVIDERLRVLGVFPVRNAISHVAEVYAFADRVALTHAHVGAAMAQAPVIIVPRVFEPELCRLLIAGYEADGGEESGFMVERGGKTVQVFDHRHKRRSDWTMTDKALIKECHTLLQRRVLPEIARAFQFFATRIERNTVARYDAETAGHFAAHRDNTTKGTAHRRFAISLNLNAEDYDGGDLMFPEYGRARFRPPTGGACVFSCSMLHEATAVARGRRYVYVPFLYDEPAAAVREENARFLAT